MPEDRSLEAEEDPALVINISDDEMGGKTAVVTVVMSGSPRVKKVASEEGNAERRFSPRLVNKEKPFYGIGKAPDSGQKVGKKRAMEESDQRREVSLVSVNSDEVHGELDAKQENVERRSSPRLHKKARPFYGVKKAGESPEKKDSKERAMADSFQGSGVSLAPLNPTKENAEERTTFSLVLVNPNEADAGCDDSKRNGLVGINANGGEMEGIVHKGSSENLSGKSDYARVKETLRIFNNHYLHFVRGIAYLEDSEQTKTKRPDLKALSKMFEMQTILYPVKRLGNLPGIDVGHQFFSRAEMVALGFHSHWLNGIDYMGQYFSKMEEYKNYTFPLAVSIVMSGVYEDDVDKSEEIVYTGQGGNNLTGDKHQTQDQVMLRGNLALKNNMLQRVPVRVTRGHESANSYSGKVYTYDGLYKVVKYWAEKGVSGFTVFKYRMKRLDGQPNLTTNQVYFYRMQAPRSLSELQGLVCEDISGGQEQIPIPATHVIDDTPVAPAGYVYSKTLQVSEGVKLPMNALGCSCKGSCVDPKTCACAKLNGSDFPYVRRDGGRLVEPKDVVFECGLNCGCGPNCINRVSQNSLRYRLEVFRTAKKGWAVRSWDSIPSGAPVCEYTGIIRRTDELDNISENDFIFEIDCLQTMKGLDGRERRLGDVSKHVDALEKIDDKKADSVPEFCIDAGSVGNVSRFINHSCQPNLFVQCILSSHHDIKLARIVLFAADNIHPLQELTYDYGYALDSVIGRNGKIKKMACYCGTTECRKRLY